MDEISSLNIYEIGNKSKRYGKHNYLVTTPERYSIRIESENELNKSDKNLLNDNRRSSNTISSANSSSNYRSCDVNASPYSKVNIKTSSNRSYNYDNSSSNSCKDDFDERCHNHEELNLNWSKTPSGSVSTRTHTISPHENFSSERTQNDEMQKERETNTESVESKAETISPTTISDVFVSQFSGNTELNYLGSGAVEIAPEIFVQSDYYLMIYIPTLDTKLPRMYTTCEDDKDNILRKAVCRMQELSARSRHSPNEKYRNEKSTNAKSTSTENQKESIFFDASPQNQNSGYFQQMDIFPIQEISEKSEDSTASKSDRNKIECEKITNEIDKIITNKRVTSPKRCWFHNRQIDIEEFVTTTVLEDYVKWKNSVSDCPECKTVIESEDTKYNLATDNTFSKQPNIKSNLLSIPSHSQKENFMLTESHLPNEIIHSNEDNTKIVAVGEANSLRHKQILVSLAKNSEYKFDSNETYLKNAIIEQGLMSFPYENRICNLKQEGINLIKDKKLELKKNKKLESSESSEKKYKSNTKLGANDSFESGENCGKSNLMLPAVFNRQNMKSTKICNFEPNAVFRVQHNIEPTNSRSTSSINSSTSSEHFKYSCLPFFNWFAKLCCRTRRNLNKKDSYLGSRNSFYFTAPKRRVQYGTTNYKNRYPLFKCNSNVT